MPTDPVPLTEEELDEVLAVCECAQSRFYRRVEYIVRELRQLRRERDERQKGGK